MWSLNLRPQDQDSYALLNEPAKRPNPTLLNRSLLKSNAPYEKIEVLITATTKGKS